ncbi:MAG: siderophore-interacting protein [Nocardiaceae bacterium]|nr:siderophore-interacting protein [Nocardiaceae bacterium]
MRGCTVRRWVPERCEMDIDFAVHCGTGRGRRWSSPGCGTRPKTPNVTRVQLN